MAFFGVEILWGYDTVKCLNMYICMGVYASRCNCVAVLYRTICLTWKPKQVWNTKKVTNRSHDNCPVRSNQRTNERSVFYAALKPMNDCFYEFSLGKKIQWEIVPIMFQERNTARDTSADSQVLLEFDWLLLSSWGSLLYGTRATRLSLFSSYISMYSIKNNVSLKILMIEVICFH